MNIHINLDERPTPRPITPFPGAVQTTPANAPVSNSQQDLTPPAAPSVPESINQGHITMAKTINSISVAALTETQAAIINNARSVNGEKKGQGADERKQIKREVFSVVKAKHGIPESQIVRAATKPGGDEYLVLHTGKKNRAGAGLAFRLGADGKWDGTYVTKDQLFPPPAPAPVEVEADVKYVTVEDDVHGDSQMEVGQSATGFPGAAAAPALPDGFSLVSVSDRTVVIELNDDWNYEVVGNNDDRFVFTRD